MYLPKNPLAALNRGVSALVEPASPMLAQMVVIRRCNLSCGYCNEYDDHSAPLPTADLYERIDHLASLGTLAVTLTGASRCCIPTSTSWSRASSATAWSAPRSPTVIRSRAAGSNA